MPKVVIFDDADLWASNSSPIHPILEGSGIRREECEVIKENPPVIRIAEQVLPLQQEGKWDEVIPQFEGAQGVHVDEGASNTSTIRPRLPPGRWISLKASRLRCKIRQGNRYIKKGGKLFPCPSSVNTSTFFDLAPDEEVVTVIHKLCARIVLEYDFSFVTKSGFGLRPAEAEAMRLVSKYTSVAVPQIYHTNFSCEDDGFIEMSLVQGSPLEGKWDTMDAKRKESICRQTWDLISKIGYVPSQYEGKFQCVADGSPSKDPLLEDLQSLPRAITSDSDLGARIYERYLHFGGTRYEHELPDMLPRSDRAVFTHGDIAHRNIMVDENGNVTGIIDWKYAGWYPDYWEYAQILRPAFWGDWSI